MRESRARILIGVIVSAAFLYWALSDLDVAEFWRQVREADYIWLVPGVVVYFVGVWARTWRWQYLLSPLGRISLRQLFPIVCIGYAGNNIYPARAGEVLRAYLLREKTGISISANMATVVVERIFDGLVMLAFVLFALPFTDLGARYSTFVLLFSALFLVALLFFLALAARPVTAERVLARLAGWFVPGRWRERVLGLSGRFLEGLASLRSGRAVLMIFGTSIVVWLLETLKYWFVMHAFPFAVPFVVLMLMNGIVNLTTSLPAAPGHLGTFDGPGIEVLRAFGVPGGIAAGYTLVLHLALWLPITLLGLYYLARFRIDLGRVRAEMAAVESA